MKKIYYILSIVGVIIVLLALAFLGYRYFYHSKIGGDSSMGMANPASTNCEKVGGRLEIQTREDGGQYGLCFFDDNRACEEWALMRGECPVGGVKTTGFDTITQKFCAWSGGSTTAQENAQCAFKNGVVCSVKDFYIGQCTNNVPSLTDKNDFYSISISYPDEPWDSTGVIKQYAEYVFNQKKTEWKIGGQSYTNEQQLAAQFPDRPKMTYEYLSTFEKSTSPKLKTVSYVFTNYEFTGGAHGNTTITTFSFGASGQMKIEDILNFNDNHNDIALTKLTATKLLNDANIKTYTDENMVRDGLGLNCIAANGTFDKVACNRDGFFFPSNFQNFVITDTGLTFIMNRYQVAPYVAGNPKVSFTWEELKPFLNKGFVIGEK
ncbi:MAG: DUF333 domain-containing protein [Candidatus Pacebacteria bacterium]|nr:DUF333 domain-containing protein [Candidatus Paceibacterota bacterium]